jgi:hypothetical protein
LLPTNQPLFCFYLWGKIKIIIKIMTQIEVLKGFESLSQKQRLMVAKKIQTKMSDELFADLDMELPDIDMSESEIMKEVKAVRNAQN